MEMYVSCTIRALDSSVKSGTLIKLPRSTAISKSAMACAENPIRPKAAPMSPRKINTISTTTANITNAVVTGKKAIDEPSMIDQKMSPIRIPLFASFELANKLGKAWRPINYKFF